MIVIPNTIERRHFHFIDLKKSISKGRLSDLLPTYTLTMTGQVNLGTFQPDPSSRSGTVGLRLCGSLILLWVVCISPVTWSGDGAREEEALLGN